MSEADISLDLPGVGEPPQAALEAETTTAAKPLIDIETLGKDLPAWKLAGLMRHQRGAAGKAVAAGDFEAALAAFEGRPLGGGR